MQTCFDFTNKFFRIRRASLQLTSVWIMITWLLLQDLIFPQSCCADISLLDRVVGRVVTSVLYGSGVKQWTASLWTCRNSGTIEQICIFMIIILFLLNYSCTDSLRCQQITTSRTHSGILMLCSNLSSIRLVMHMTHFSFQVSFLSVFISVIDPM